MTNLKSEKQRNCNSEQDNSEKRQFGYEQAEKTKEIFGKGQFWKKDNSVKERSEQGQFWT